MPALRRLGQAKVRQSRALRNLSMPPPHHTSAMPTHRRLSGFPPATESLHRRSMAPQALHTVFAKRPRGLRAHPRCPKQLAARPVLRIPRRKALATNNANIVLSNRRHLLTIGGNLLERVSE